MLVLAHCYSCNLCCCL